MHIPVLLTESLNLLDLREGDVYLDATLGLGGHAEEVWKRFGPSVQIIGIDRDLKAVEMARERLQSLGAKPDLRVMNFRDIANLEQRPTKILFDLGWNKTQFETPADGEGRGFSFQKDEPLLMTFGESSDAPFTAYDIVNSWEEENIATILFAYGEEQFSRRIACRIVEERQNGPIKTSLQLAELVKSATPVWYRFKRIHPATKTFQALRIAVNDELRALEEGLAGAFQILSGEGRIAVISFHSLEDRIVKRFFKKLAEEEKVEILTKKPTEASEAELATNPRSRSAKLRAITKK